MSVSLGSDGAGYEYYEDGWHGTWAQDGGVTNQQAIHHVDALTWICGEATVSAMSTKRANQLQAEDTLVAAIELENGGLATLELTTARPKDIEASITLTEPMELQIGGVALNKIEQWNFTDALDDEKRLSVTFQRKLIMVMVCHYRQLKKFLKPIASQK